MTEITPAAPSCGDPAPFRDGWFPRPYFVLALVIAGMGIAAGMLGVLAHAIPESVVPFAVFILVGMIPLCWVPRGVLPPVILGMGLASFGYWVGVLLGQAMPILDVGIAVASWGVMRKVLMVFVFVGLPATLAANLALIPAGRGLMKNILWIVTLTSLLFCVLLGPAGYSPTSFFHVLPFVLVLACFALYAGGILGGGVVGGFRAPLRRS